MVSRQNALTDWGFKRVIRTECQNQTLMVWMELGKVNAMDTGFCEDLCESVAQFRSGDAKLLVFRSATASRVFSAGIDLKRVVLEPPEYVEDFFPKLIELFESVYDCHKPTLAVVEGAAVAGGCVLAAACRARLVTKAATFGMPTPRLRVPIPQLANEILRSAAPEAIADQLHDGTLIDASKALECGLATEVVSDEDLDSSIQRFAIHASNEPANLSRDLSQRTIRRDGYKDADQKMIEYWKSDELRTRLRQYIDSSWR